MAELVLGKLGAAAGAALLPKEFAFLGESVGRLAGLALDTNFFSPPVEGPRVKAFHLTEGQEGAGIPMVYGRARVGAQLLWATNFRERRDVEGGKGGPRIATYSYTLSFAVGLCEGEVARISRCWANGEPFDLSRVTWRLYRGTEDQLPDPLIEAVEGSDAAPAYRGVAYVVFEDMPVDQFGGRMPQLSFEVIRPLGGEGVRLETAARAVNMIPGSGEFALSTTIIRRRIAAGHETAENLHGPELKSDFEASVDQLEAELPNVSRVQLVVAWFGDDLRCGECTIRPGVEIAEKMTVPQAWSVAGVDRGSAHVVSAVDGRPSYGGTPCDASVREAVALLKARGFHVTLYPFLLMDIPEGAELPHPSGVGEQPPYPWRGRIAPAAGDVVAQVADFFGQYRPFILHYAGLADEVGADGILIGSELIGLTHAASDVGYPAVDGLRELVEDVRAIVGEACEISYAADWTEYGARTSGDSLDFPLDPLWAHPDISYVGLDWYPPMADWRDGGAHADAGFGDGRSRAYLAANIAGGEAFDWYYADAEGRDEQARLPISDGAYGEPWVFRQKDIRGWWGSAHHARVAGVRSSSATVWTAGMKPVRFVEMGIPAVDKGANQPNVFYDPKSSESALPHFSSGKRDDLVQRAAIEAFHHFWADPANNPVSAVYSEHAGRMLPEDGVALWAWDGRPYPAFPMLDGVWGDAGNWRLGHWLNGRTSLGQLADVVADICARAGVEASCEQLQGVVTGYAATGPATARSMLEPLLMVHGADATERDGRVVFRMQGVDAYPVDAGRLVEQEGGSITLVQGGLEASARRVRLRFADAEADHMPALVVSEGAVADEIVDVEAAMLLDRDQAQACAERLAGQIALSRDQVQFALAADGIVIEPGDVVSLSGQPWRVTGRSDGALVAFEAERAGAAAAPVLTGAAAGRPVLATGQVEPDVVIVDGPPLPGAEEDSRPIGFAYAQPWAGPVTFEAGASADQLMVRGRIDRPCTMGRLIGALYPHVSGRWQDASVWVAVAGPAPMSRTEGAVLNGANMALVEHGDGWELIQFREAELVSEGVYVLSGLLRGQQGTEAAMAGIAPEGARVLFLTGAETRLDVVSWERGLELGWRARGGAAGDDCAWEARVVHAARSDQEWSPVRLAAAWSGGELILSWVRRARLRGDGWNSGEPPCTQPERYLVRIDGEASSRAWEVSGPVATYPESERVADFPYGGVAVIQVAQLGPDAQPGGFCRLELSVPVP